MNLKTLPLLGALLLAPALFGADGFVGKISLQQSDAKGKVSRLTQSMKGLAVRTDIEGGQGGMIMDFAKKEMIILIDSEHMYMVQPINSEQVAAKAKEHAAVDSDVEDTGKTETILGHVCKQVLVHDKGKEKKTTEMWIANDLGFFGGLGSGGGGPGGMFGGKGRGNNAESGKWEQILKGQGGFPMRVITRNAADKELFRMEVTKIEAGGVTDADFQPPKGYTKLEMPDMGGMNPFK